MGYPYKPLDSSVDTIRLMVLHPRQEGEDETVVRCSLIHTDFLSKPEYEALSYTWGNRSPSKHISINGIEVSVRENLYSALYCLRLQKDRLLWADAICIDQSNLEERRYQVGLMAFIYSRAYCVLIWLGPPGPLEVETVLEKSYGNWFDKQGWLWLLGHPYWSRLWIIQEAALGIRLTVCCGGACRDWDSFVCAARNFVTLSQNKSLLFNLDAKRTGRHWDTNRLETLLEDFQYAKCDEAMDKIYGFLGLAHDCQDGSLEADYSKSPFDLYADVIRFFCRRRVLRNGCTNDLDRSMRVMRFSQLVQRLLGDIGATAANRSVTTDVVQVRGAFGGRILHLGPNYTEMLSTYDANKKWKLSFESHYPLPQDVKKLREANESYGATLLAMADRDVSRVRGIEPRDMYSQAKRVDRLWDDNENDWFRQELDNEVGRDMTDTPAITDSTPTSDRPRMFLGNNYLMGLVPQQAKEGDLICQFWKCDVVALLRLEESTGFYRIVGRVHLSTGSLRDLKPVYVDWKDPIENAQVIYIKMDINTLRLLTC